MSELHIHFTSTIPFVHCCLYYQVMATRLLSLYVVSFSNQNFRVGQYNSCGQKNRFRDIFISCQMLRRMTRAWYLSDLDTLMYNCWGLRNQLDPHVVDTSFLSAKESSFTRQIPQISPIRLSGDSPPIRYVSRDNNNTMRATISSLYPRRRSVHRASYVSDTRTPVSQDNHKNCYC